MMKRVTSIFMGVLMLFSLGCVSAGKHAQDVRDDSGERLTVGTVQREIRVGMTSADVVSVLGSPNMVTTDAKRREVWVYDKISTEHVYSSSSGGVSALIFGAGAGSSVGGAGGLGGGYSGDSGASATRQRTLTVIVKFDEKSQVRDFSYRQSSF